MAPRVSYTYQDGAHRVEGEVRIQASREAVWEILTDYEKLSNLIPGMTSSRLVERTARDQAVVEQEGRVKILSLTIGARIVLQVREDPLSHISFEMMEGDFDLYRGTWTLRHSKGVVTLVLLIEAARFIPAPRPLISLTVRTIARTALRAIARQAESGVRSSRPGR